ncbi:hypothetical protein TWF132_006447 [Orbilia oligospora]|nr:hypothetical protein TWF132_006447 [Orbilia oligospora]
MVFNRRFNETKPSREASSEYPQEQDACGEKNGEYTEMADQDPPPQGEVYNKADFESYGIRDKDKMGKVSVFLLIINRMIGTGIFELPSTILAGCGSLGASLLLWFLGTTIAFCGLMVHIEFGLMIPRHPDKYGRNWNCTPRSGGEKNYFEYLFIKRGLLPVCVYGLIFLFLGNTAGNSYICAQYFLRLVGTANPSEWLTKGVAVAVITFACVMHSIWRTGGIWLLNALAIVKILILWAIISLGYAARSGRFENIKAENPPPWSNFEPDQSFEGRSTGFYGWTISILGVLYAFGGYENANYVLSEVKNPTTTFAPSAIAAIVFTGLTYILTIVSYYLVIPIEQLFPDENGKTAKPVLLFFERLFDDNEGVQRAVSALVALSSLGNLMTTTFVASRVKQEIAKEGIIILPAYHFWKREYESGWRLIANLFGGSGGRPKSNDNGLSGKDKAPIPALILHWGTSLILILAPPGYLVYQLFTRLHSYMFQAIFGMILGGGILYLRYVKPLRDPAFQWVALSKEAFHAPGVLRPVFPAIYFVATSFLVIAPFIQHGDTGESKLSQDNRLKWFVFPAVCFSLFGAGILFWFILDVLLPHTFDMKLYRARRAEFEGGNLAWEGVQLKWVPKSFVEGKTPLPECDPRLPYTRQGNLDPETQNGLSS